VTLAPNASVANEPGSDYADDMNRPEPEKMNWKDIHISSEGEKHLTQGPWRDYHSIMPGPNFKVLPIRAGFSVGGGGPNGRTNRVDAMNIGARHAITERMSKPQRTRVGAERMRREAPL